MDVFIPDGHHTLPIVYREMMYRICKDYPGLPLVWTMKMNEIKWFYDGLRAELRERTKPGS